MTDNKRFHSESNCIGYYTEIIDEQKKLDLTIPNPKKNLLVEELVDLLNALYEENEQLKQQFKYIQNSISEHIKHQKTELGQKALQEIIEDYNEWLLGHKEL